VGEDGLPTRGEAAKKYVADCIDKGAADADFFVVWCEKPDGPADVCHTGNGPTSGANARLIAAAPDLLTALREVRDGALESDRARNTPGWERLREIVDYAIAKAVGR
jgi:hypothetical protein